MMMREIMSTRKRMEMPSACIILPGKWWWERLWVQGKGWQCPVLVYSYQENDDGGDDEYKKKYGYAQGLLLICCLQLRLDHPPKKRQYAHLFKRCFKGFIIFLFYVVIKLKQNGILYLKGNCIDFNLIRCSQEISVCKVKYKSIAKMYYNEIFFKYKPIIL